MKVLQVINGLDAGGAEKLLVDAAIKFFKNGIEIHVLLLQKRDSPFLKKLEKFPEINILYLSTSGTLYNPLFVFKLKKILRNYDVIHVHLFPSLYWVSLAKTISSKNHTLVYTEHNTTNRRRNHPFFKFTDRILYKNYNKIISISDSVDISLKKHLGEKFKNILKIYNGIDLKEINDAKQYSKTELNIPEDSKLIIQISSFTAQKNQETLINALKYLPENIYLLLVGDGSLKSKNKALSEALNLSERVRFLGIRNDVPRLLKSVDAVVLSSNFEGLSLSSIEGLASGKPFLASNVPGLSEVVLDYGILFENNNSEELAMFLKKALFDSKYAKEVSEKCELRAKEFDINSMIRHYSKLYKSL